MGLKMLGLGGPSLFGGGFSTWLHTMNFYRNLNLTKVVLFPWNFLSLKNLAPHDMPWTSKKILTLEKLYYCFEVFFLLEILLRTLDMVVLEGSSFGLRFSKKFLPDLKMSSGSRKCFYINLILNVLSSKYFAESYGVFFPLKFLSNTGTNFCTFRLFTLSLV